MKKLLNLFSSFIEFLRRSKKTLLLIIVVAAITLALSTAISIWLSRITNLHFPSIGTIKTIGVKAYWDANLTNETDKIQWGTIYLGSSNNVTIHVRSVSNYNTVLNLSTANWTFQNSNNATVQEPANRSLYMDLTWNYNDTTVHPGDTIQTTLTLIVKYSFEFTEFLIENDVKGFNFDIMITASEQTTNTQQ